MIDNITDILDIIENAVTLNGNEVFGGDKPNSLIVKGNEDDGYDYRVTVEKVPK
jgi:hypothetical protein